MQIGKNFGMFHDHAGTIVGNINWDYQTCLAKFNELKQTATRSSSGFVISNELTFGFSSPRQWQNCVVNLPSNKLGAWIIKTMNSNIRTWEWTILDPMTNTAVGTDLIVDRNTSYNNWSWLWCDGKIYTVSCEDKKLYRFKPDGTGYEYVTTIKTPNNQTTSLNMLGGFSSNGRIWFTFNNQNNSTNYVSYLDMNTFESWNGSISNSLTFLQGGELMLPNGNIVIFDPWGRYRIYSVSANNTFTQIRSGTIGSYMSVGFCKSCPFAGIENWIYTGFNNHGTQVIALNYETGITKTESHTGTDYENNWNEQGQLLPTGDIFTWLKNYGTSGPGGNAGVLYNCSTDSFQYVIPSDGNTSQAITWNSKLLQNGKIFIYRNADSLFRGKLIDIGLNTSFDYSLLTHPWFGCGWCF